MVLCVLLHFVVVPSTASVTSIIIQSTSQSNVPSTTTSSQSVAVSTIVSQSVNITANESTGDNNSSTTVAIVASVAGSLLGLCIIGICIAAISIKKYKSRNCRKMRHLEFSAVSL